MNDVGHLNIEFIVCEDRVFVCTLPSWFLDKTERVDGHRELGISSNT